MIEGLQPYAEYKPSGLPWLDVVPQHWDMVPNRAVMLDQRQVVGENSRDYTLLSLTLRGVIARDMVNPKGKFPARFNTYKIVRPDDFVFCLFDIDETPRGVGLASQKGMITGAYDIFSPRGGINHRFLYHYYLFVDEGKLMKPLYTGLRKTIKRGAFAGLKAPSPPPDEQAAIVRFLDHANRKIDGFIRAKRKLIALLGEQKQAIIHRAVTRGLDPNAPLKPSGIPWLNDIPMHWGIRRMKNVGKTKIGLTYSPADVTDESGCLVLRASNIKNGKLVHADNVFVKKKIPSELRVKKNDILICARSGSRSLVGKSALIPADFEGVTFGAFMSVFRSPWNDFVFWALNSNLFKFVMAGFETSTINQLTQGDLNNPVIPAPPRQEQLEIVKFVEEQTSSINTVIARTEREIALMQEYRTRLTADVVTGKLDVRTAAAKLPDLAVESGAEQAIDDVEEEIETEAE